MDDDDKVRRNLVVFSAGVVLLAWLRLPLTVATERLMGSTGTWQASPGRAWAAAAVVLMYLTARFYYTGGGRKAIDKLSKQYNVLLHLGIGRLVDKMASQSSIDSVCTWNPSVAELVQGWARDYAAAGHPLNISPRLSIGSRDRNGGNIWSKSGKAEVRAFWAEGNNTPQKILYHQRADVTYELRFPTRLRTSARAFCFSWVLSEDALSLLAPYLLASAAAIVISWKLGSTFLE
jgi:hypothetical protein